MSADRRCLPVVAIAFVIWGGAACQGPPVEGGPGQGDNLLSVEVGPGPAGDYVNGLFTSLTVCVPGTHACQTISGLLVDTGSVGLRILGSALTMQLPVHASDAGEPIAECAPFLDQVAWGSLHTADVQLGSERIPSVPIQVIENGRHSRPPSCTGVAVTDVQSLGANGILGLGMFARDCGDPCTLPVSSVSNPGMYYACGAGPGDCGLAAVPVAKQLPQPVTRLGGGNDNGVVVQLDEAPAGGAASVRGTIVLGIGTRPNNALASVTKLMPDERGLFSVRYPAGGPVYGALLDTGSNASYFLDPALSGIPRCTAALASFYCPGSLTTLEATLMGVDGGAVPLRFFVEDPGVLLSHKGRFAYRELAGPLPGFSPSSPGFVLGLPVHFGRRVFVAIEGRDTPAGPGPFMAL